MSLLIEFIFPHRLHRLAYFLRLLATNILAGCIYAVGSTQDAYIGIISFIALGAYQVFFIALPRIRDINMSSWWLLLVLVPIANIVFGVILLFRAPPILSHRPNNALERTATAP